MRSHFSKHFGDDSLIAHLDGELSARQAARVRKHLQSCWQCRLRLSEIEETILQVTRAVGSDRFPGTDRLTVARQRFAVDSTTVIVPADRAWNLGWLRRLGPGVVVAGLTLAATSWLWLGAPSTKPVRAVKESPPPVETRAVVPVIPPPARIIVPPAPNVDTPSRTDLLSLEVEVRYALHRARACMGEPIEVQRLANGTIRVHGTARNEERRLEWVKALDTVRRTPWLEIEVTSFEQSPLSLGELPQSPAQPQSSSVEAAEPPIQKTLEEYVTPQGDRPHRAAALANEVVTHAETMLAHAWALRRLDAAYGAERATAIPSAARHLLDSMLSEHVMGLREESAFLLATAGPVLVPAAGAEAAGVESGPSTGGIEESIPNLFVRCRLVHSLLLDLFTTAGAGQDAGTLARRALPELRVLKLAAADTGPPRVAKEIK